MRGRTLVVLTALAALGPAAHAAAQGDPIMPLGQVQPGMKCTGLSVFHGQAIEPFDVEIEDIVGQASNGESLPKLLVRVSGGKVEATGVGPGFSGSPIYCPAADGTMHNAGAISETVGDYGGKTVLATPIEEIIGTPVDAPTGPAPAAAGRAKRHRDASLLARARPLSSPITVSGLAPSLMKGLRAAAKRRGVILLAAPPVPADSSPIVPFAPGSAVSVGMSSGDVSIGAVGTVAYVDGKSVWAFGHSFDGAGARSLLLQDAYVSAVINNPLQLADVGGTYKFSGPVHTVGTVTDDGFNAVAGRVGAFPTTTRVRVYAEDLDRDAQTDTEVDVADETDLGNPVGYSALGYVGAIAVSQGATDLLGGAPQRVAGQMCFQVTLRERAQPLRFCNRYVSDGTTPGDGSGGNPLALTAGSDAAAALALFDTYKGKPVHITEASARVKETRAQRQAYLRSVRLPRRVRRGANVRGTLVVQVVRGAKRTIHFTWHVPLALHAGRRTLRLLGTDPDSGGGFFDTITIDLSGEDSSVYDSEGPRSLNQLATAFRSLRHYDGITLKSGEPFYRDPTYRIGGAARTSVRVLPRR